MYWVRSEAERPRLQGREGSDEAVEAGVSRSWDTKRGCACLRDG